MSTLKRFICPPIMGRGSQGMYIPLHVAPDEIGPNDLCSYAEAHAIEVERDALRSVLIALLREHDSAPDAKGSDGWDAARKLLEGE